MTLLYFAPVRWHSYWQRPHFFVRHFMAATGGAVVWVDPYPVRLPTWRDLTAAPAPIVETPIPRGLDVVRFRTLPVEPLPGGAALTRLHLTQALRRALLPHRGSDIGIAIGRPSGLALAALDAVAHEWSVYDAMDDFPQFYRGLSRQSAARIERAIASRATIVVTSSAALWRKFEPLGSKRLMVRNAFDMESLPPIDARGRRDGIGYVGCVSEWFDWTIVRRLAETHPHTPVRIVGPRTSEPRSLPANVQLLPSCSHETAVEHMRTFAVGLIPFKRTPLTAAVDPIKYYAYRAMGLPVISTRFGEMIEHGPAAGTHFIRDSDDAAGAVAAAAAMTPDAATTLAFRAEHDWSRRFADAGLFPRLGVR